MAETKVLSSQIETRQSAPSSPTEGQFYYDEGLDMMRVYTNGAWRGMGGGAVGGGTNQVFLETDAVVSANYTISAGKNAVTAGPVSISDGVTVTVPNGSVWTIV